MTLKELNFPELVKVVSNHDPNVYEVAPLIVT